MTFRPFLLLSVFSLFVLTACTSDAQNDIDMAEAHEAHDDHPMRSNDETRVSPNAGVMQTIGTTSVHIMYGRPSVNISSAR